jgi:hypothetical protein
MLALIVQVMADPSTNPPTFIAGDLNIKYNSRLKPNTVGEYDVYSLNVNISNSAKFIGVITNIPIVMGNVYGVSQNSSLEYNIDCFVVNPNWTPQSPPRVIKEKQVARMYGKVPISQDGLYNYDVGTIKIGGTLAGAGEAPFKGSVQGKPLYRPKGWFDSLKQETLSLTRNVGGQTKSIAIKKYDKMAFRQHTMGSGPIGMYPEATVNGEMIYDYDRGVWYFDNVIISYYNNGQQIAQKLTGNIRWSEQPAKGNSRLGEYQFDIRVNEPPPNEASVFNTSAPADESAFFEVDDKLRTLGGVMKYSDTLSGNKVIASSVKIDLIGNKLSKQETMNIFKLVFFTCIVPVNAE